MPSECTRAWLLTGWPFRASSPGQELAAARQGRLAAAAEATSAREELEQARAAAAAAAEKVHNDQLVLAKEIKRLRGQVRGLLVGQGQPRVHGRGAYGCR
jgi:hypothetical protein